MSIVYIGDTHHRYFQEHHVTTLGSRIEDLRVIFWSTEGFDVFRELDELATTGALQIIGSRHGAIPAAHWTARNPDKVKKLFLLHPSLHLNLAGMDVPQPHFVSTMLICHSKVTSPSADELSELAGKFFHNYTLHLTSESVELSSTLGLLSI